MQQELVPLQGWSSTTQLVFYHKAAAWWFRDLIWESGSTSPPTPHPERQIFIDLAFLSVGEFYTKETSKVRWVLIRVCWICYSGSFIESGNQASWEIGTVHLHFSDWDCAVRAFQPIYRSDTRPKRNNHHVFLQRALSLNKSYIGML